MADFHLSAICSDPGTWLEPLGAAMAMFQINSESRMKMFLAQIGHESGGFSLAPENMNYSAPRLLEVFKHNAHAFSEDEAETYAHNPEAIANHVYADMGGNGDEESGDGWRYRGRPLIGLTTRGNYERCGRGIGVDLVAAPELLEIPEYAAKSAGWYWFISGCNEAADAGDFEDVTRRINKALQGMDDRVRWLAKVEAAYS